MSKKNPVQGANSSSTAKVNTVYTLNNRRIDPVTKTYNLKVPDGTFVMNINNVKIQMDDNIQDIQVHEHGVNISFKK